MQQYESSNQQIRSHWDGAQNELTSDVTKQAAVKIFTGCLYWMVNIYNRLLLLQPSQNWRTYKTKLIILLSLKCKKTLKIRTSLVCNDDQASKKLFKKIMLLHSCPAAVWIYFTKRPPIILRVLWLQVLGMHQCTTISSWARWSIWKRRVGPHWSCGPFISRSSSLPTNPMQHVVCR